MNRLRPRRGCAAAAAWRIALFVACLTTGCDALSNASGVPPAGDLVLSGALVLSIPVPVAEGPILEAAAYVDGHLVGNHAFSPGASNAGFAVPQTSIAAGDHEVSLQIVRQTVSPTLYRAIGAVLVENTATGSRQQFAYPSDATANLNPGESITLRFRVESR